MRMRMRGDSEDVSSEDKSSEDKSSEDNEDRSSADSEDNEDSLRTRWMRRRYGCSNYSFFRLNRAYSKKYGCHLRDRGTMAWAFSARPSSDYNVTG